jgi:hypothetical protein
MKIGVISWDDIRSLSVRQVKSGKFLCIELVDREKYLSRLPRWKRTVTAANEAMGLSALTINFIGLSPGIRRCASTCLIRRVCP